MIQAKRLLIITGISVGLAACHSNPNTVAKNTSDTTVVATVNSPAVSNADTAGLAAFKAEKKARYEDSLKNVGAQREREQRRAKTSYAATTSRSRSSYASSGSRTSTGTSGYASSADYPTAKKKSHAARNGALIGAGAGALTGALVTKKNRGVGALIGGVAGGAAGFGVGKIVEHKKKNNQ
ncbi:glycine zipper domain-containing protein [Mucilaginibacter lacusdianchii]|uniref:glycine zipper domain-containing protein n=1 Tax=Mucilaginibacter lacusdianchii TaxID=2684211 RepID=UPI00131C63DD|nr:glycine zipper domain-containing protein [Mucilaginibacter sp. JXJ CY 39]